MRLNPDAAIHNDGQHNLKEVSLVDRQVLNFSKFKSSEVPFGTKSERLANIKLCELELNGERVDACSRECGKIRCMRKAVVL
jgi:hypothetical protein